MVVIGRPVRPATGKTKRSIARISVYGKRTMCNNADLILNFTLHVLNKWKYVYLGRDQHEQLHRWRTWISSESDIPLCKKLDQKTKSKVFNSHVLQAITITYASETWSTTKKNEENLLVTERVMELKILVEN